MPLVYRPLVRENGHIRLRPPPVMILPSSIWRHTDLPGAYRLRTKLRLEVGALVFGLELPRNR